MDWGLFDSKAGDNKFLREEIVYSGTVSVDNAVRLMTSFKLRKVDYFNISNEILVDLLFCDN